MVQPPDKMEKYDNNRKDWYLYFDDDDDDDDDDVGYIYIRSNNGKG